MRRFAGPARGGSGAGAPATGATKRQIRSAEHDFAVNLLILYSRAAASRGNPWQNVGFVSGRQCRKQNSAYIPVARRATGCRSRKTRFHALQPRCCAEQRRCTTDNGVVSPGNVVAARTIAMSCRTTQLHGKKPNCPAGQRRFPAGSPRAGPIRHDTPAAAPPAASSTSPVAPGGFLVYANIILNNDVDVPCASAPA